MGRDVAKARQLEYYDQGMADPEFEINRPHGESHLYTYVMDFKFAKLLQLLGHSLDGLAVLSVCCGSGMDAEYLVHAGARVTALDISAGCIARATERKRRYSVDFELIRGDVEHLPFADRAFDYSFVHDGLHHLLQLDDALHEMVRVVRRGVLISEPTKAAITTIPTRVGLMSAFEDAGNQVNRPDASRLAEVLRNEGLTDIRSARYLLRYGHPPSAMWRSFDKPFAQAIARLIIVHLGASILSRAGNKLVLVAERSTGDK